MAKKSSKKTAKPANKTTKSSGTRSGDNVVRIKAGAPAKKKTDKVEKTASVASTTTVISAEKPAKTAKADKPVKVKKPRTSKGIGFLGPVGAYFGGAWFELRQVRWPNRRATWSLTGAVLAYSAFFVVLVLLLDAAFKYMFQLILGK